MREGQEAVVTELAELAGDEVHVVHRRARLTCQHANKVVGGQTLEQAASNINRTQSDET